VTSTPAINKWDVAASFSRAATTYDAVAELQRHAGERLLSLTPANDYADILDLGCGTGYFSRRLLARFPAKVTGIDIATGMLTVANLRRPAANILWCAGDAEALPLMPATQALIYSNLTVQWCQLSSCLKEAWRVLQPGGCFAFTTLGPDTLQELRGAWRKVDRHIHVNRFVSATTIRSAAAHHGFQCALETEEHKNRLRAIMDIHALLTPEQRAELAEIREERKEEWRRKHRYKEYGPLGACSEDRRDPCGDASGRALLGCMQDRYAELSEPCRGVLEEGPEDAAYDAR